MLFFVIFLQTILTKLCRRVKMNPVKYILFDLDGTLVDSAPGITKCFQYAFVKMGLEPPAIKDLYSCIGPPLLTSFCRFFPNDEARALQGVTLYRERYRVEGWKECTLYPGVERCLCALTDVGKKLALATSKPQPFAENILSAFGIRKYFSAVVGSKLDNSFDDKAKIMARAMELLSAERSETVMVGDRKQDAIGAKKNSVAFVGVRVGFAESGELETTGADFLVDDFSALETLLLRL